MKGRTEEEGSDLRRPPGALGVHPGILDSRDTHQGELTHPLVLSPPSILTIYFRPMAEGTPVMTHMPPSGQHPACELMTSS